MALYPLLLEPIYKEKVWGGRTLETLGRTLPGEKGTRVGESWEVADLDSTSPSGGGGDAAHSRIRNGPWIKRTLDEVLADFGRPIMGSRPLAEDGRFPLLLKYLDARENLSVQVHPSSAYVADHPEARAKSEAWYIVAAEPGAVIYTGLKAEVVQGDIEAAIRSGTVEELLAAVPAVPGDCHYLPSGRCHALGAGVLVAEVGTPSDTTFRVYDWGRGDRELHVDQALACMDFTTPDASRWEPGTEEVRGATTIRNKVACEHFLIDEWTVPAGAESTLETGEVSVLMVIAGEGALGWGDETRHSLAVGPGSTVLVPAALTAGSISATNSVTLLRVTIPEPS